VEIYVNEDKKIDRGRRNRENEMEKMKGNKRE
jgi:hypothetical protein